MNRGFALEICGQQKVPLMFVADMLQEMFGHPIFWLAHPQVFRLQAVQLASVTFHELLTPWPLPLEHGHVPATLLPEQQHGEFGEKSPLT